MIPLSRLNPKFLGAGGPGFMSRSADGSYAPAPERCGVGLLFDCPCGQCAGNPVYVAFRNPIDGGAAYADPGEPTWERTGADFDTLSLSPSILRRTGCGWHGWVRDGQVITC